MENNTQLGSNAAMRVLSVLDVKPKWDNYIPYTDFGITRAGIPLAKEYIKSRKVGKEIAQYNNRVPKKDRLLTDNNDKYFHQRAMYQAAQGGVLPALVAALAGEIREYSDAIKYRKMNKSEEYIEKERKKDLQNNYEAIRMALEDGRPVDQVIKPNPTMVLYEEKKKNGQI